MELRRGNRTGKFPFFAVLITMGNPKRPPIYKQTDSTSMETGRSFSAIALDLLGSNYYALIWGIYTL